MYLLLNMIVNHSMLYTNSINSWKGNLKHFLRQV